MIQLVACRMNFKKGTGSRSCCERQRQTQRRRRRPAVQKRSDGKRAGRMPALQAPGAGGSANSTGTQIARRLSFVPRDRTRRENGNRLCRVLSNCLQFLGAQRCSELHGGKLTDAASTL